jgi:hypothetical protein
VHAMRIVIGVEEMNEANCHTLNQGNHA